MNSIGDYTIRYAGQAFVLAPVVRGNKEGAAGVTPRAARAVCKGIGNVQKGDVPGH